MKNITSKTSVRRKLDTKCVEIWPKQRYNVHIIQKIVVVGKNGRRNMDNKRKQGKEGKISFYHIFPHMT